MFTKSYPNETSFSGVGMTQ